MLFIKLSNFLFKISLFKDKLILNLLFKIKNSLLKNKFFLSSSFLDLLINPNKSNYLLSNEDNFNIQKLLDAPNVPSSDPSDLKALNFEYYENEVRELTFLKKEKFIETIETLNRNSADATELHQTLMNRMNKDKSLSNIVEKVSSSSDINLSLNDFFGIFKNFKNTYKDNNFFRNTPFEKDSLELARYKIEYFKHRLQNPSEIIDSNFVTENPKLFTDLIEEGKPLGQMGEITLNQLVSVGIQHYDILREIISAHPELIGGAAFILSIIPPLLLFKGVLKSYNKFNPHPDLTNASPKDKIEHSISRTNFFLYGAPLITLSLFGITSVVSALQLKKLSLELSINTNPSKPELENLTSLGFFGFLKNQKNKKWGWLSLVFLYLVLIGLHNIKVIDLNRILEIIIYLSELFYYFSINYLHWVLWYLLLYSLIMIIHFSMKILTYYLYTKNSESLFLSAYFRRKIEDIKLNYKDLDEKSKNEHVKRMVDFYYNQLFFFICLFFFTILLFIIYVFTKKFI